MPALENQTSLALFSERVKQANSLAIVLADNAPFADLAAGAVLASLLRRAEKVVTVFTPPDAAHRFPELAPFLEGANEPIREFIISFDLTRSPIKELRYEREEKRLDILLSPLSGRIRRDDIEFRAGALRYDLAIALNVGSPEAAAASIAGAPEIFIDLPVAAVGVDERAPFDEINISRPGRTSAEFVYELALLLGSELDRPDAELLLASLAEATGGLAAHRMTPDAFLTVGNLMKYGAKVPLPVAAAKNLTQITGRCLARSRFDSPTETAWSLLTADDFEKTGARANDAPHLLSELSRAYPAAKKTALLAEPERGAGIAAYLVVDSEETLARLVQGGFTAMGATLVSRELFPSHREAEDVIARLLEGGGAVQ